MSQEVLLCSVINCPNSERQKVSSTVFYFVPKDLARATKWTDALMGHVAPLYPKSLICSNHFEPNAFEANSSKLKKNAIPTIFIPVKSEKRNFTSTNIDELKDTCKASSFKKLKLVNISSLLEPHDIDNQEMNEETPEKSINHPLHTVTVKEDIDAWKEDIKEPMGSFSDDQPAYVGDNSEENIKYLQMLQQSLQDEETMLQKQDQDVNSELEQLEEELETKRAILKNLQNEEIEVLEKCFSKTQIRLLMGQLSKARWTLDDLAMAYTISCLTSRDFYGYLRNDLRYPLPALSNISRCYKSNYRTKDNKK